MESKAHDPSRAGQCLRALAAAVVTTGLTLVALAVVMRWDTVRWDVPLEYNGDGLLSLEIVQTALEQPWYLHAPRLGAPNGLEMYDYPCADTLDILLIKAIGLFDHRPAVVINLFFVLTFPLAALTMLAAARKLGGGWPASIAAGVLFAFLPYHALRNIHHIFLSSYFPIALMAAVLVEIATGQIGLASTHENGRRRLALSWRPVIWAIAVAALLGTANPYYAFFALLLLPVAGLVDVISRRRIGGLIFAGAVATVLAASATLNMIPSLVYEHHHGMNSLGRTRPREEAEHYGLKLTHLLMPAPDHLSSWSTSVRRFYHTSLRPLENENRTAALGAIGAAGFVGLLVSLSIPRPNRRPPLQALAQLNLAAFLIGTLGGLGVFVSMLYSQFRSYNRISIFIGCFSLLAVALWVDTGLTRLRGLFSRAAGLLALAGLVAFGVWDGATRCIRQETASISAIWEADEKIVRSLEDDLPRGSRVFQLPAVVFPESPVVHDLDFDRSLVGYLHSTNLEWSHGAMRGRAGALWQEGMAKRLEQSETREAALAELERDGFHALWIDWLGYNADDRDRLRNEFVRRLGKPFVSRPDGTTECFQIKSL